VTGLNEALPRWRSFSSDGSDASEPPPRQPEERGGRRWALHPRLLAAALLAVLGGVVVTAAIALAVISLTASPGSSRPLAVGQPLDDLTSPGGDSSAVQGAVTSGGAVASEIIVDVGGAVADPGLHRLDAGDRVGDAIAAAGGFGPRVDISAAAQTLNLAAELSDGAKILVPELGTRGPASGGPAAAGDGRIDLNSADQGTLEELPGIGPVTAERIVQARAERRFESVDELLERGVVGESVFQDIRELITAGG
jgi:competence protein ComEA